MPPDMGGSGDAILTQRPSTHEATQQAWVDAQLFPGTREGVELPSPVHHWAFKKQDSVRLGTQVKYVAHGSWWDLTPSFFNIAGAKQGQIGFICGLSLALTEVMYVHCCPRNHSRVGSGADPSWFLWQASHFWVVPSLALALVALLPH